MIIFCLDSPAKEPGVASCLRQVAFPNWRWLHLFDATHNATVDYMEFKEVQSFNMPFSDLMYDNNSAHVE